MRCASPEKACGHRPRIAREQSPSSGEPSSSTRRSLTARSEKENIGFIPWFPLAVGKLATKKGPLTDIAKKHDATPAQIALAWLLKRSPVMLPIPGTSNVKHLEENVAAVGIGLTDEEFQRIARG